MDCHPDDWLDRARRDAKLSPAQLWLRYFGLGGMTSALELEAILHGALQPADADRDRIVHALNERLAELGAEQRLGYSSEA